MDPAQNPRTILFAMRNGWGARQQNPPALDADATAHELKFSPPSPTESAQQLLPLNVALQEPVRAQPRYRLSEVAENLSVTLHVGEATPPADAFTRQDQSADEDSAQTEHQAARRLQLYCCALAAYVVGASGAIAVTSADASAETQFSLGVGLGVPGALASVLGGLLLVKYCVLHRQQVQAPPEQAAVDDSDQGGRVCEISSRPAVANAT